MRRLLATVLAIGCRSDKPATHTTAATPTAPAPQPASTDAAIPVGDDPYAKARDAMVTNTIESRRIIDPNVLAAMRAVHRHELVSEDQRARAYDDTPLPIGYDQTISQPYIVAAMTEEAKIKRGEKVLEIGTGSGYQAAVLAAMGADVYSIEIVEPLAKRTHALLAKMGYDKIHLRIGDGYQGWPEAAPFDAIIVTAAPEKIPQPLIDQLAIGGRLVIPVGARDDQHLRIITRGKHDTMDETRFAVRFVPMTGEAQRPQRD
jgi:protein-L-isoaspartate(D-aspartate) O-methyltransferase